MQLLLRKIHTQLYRFSVAFFFMLLWPVRLYLKQKPERYKYINSVRRIIIRMSTMVSGIFFATTYEVPIDWSRTYIIVGNHTSNLDISAINLSAKNNHVFIGKEELKKNLVLGYFFRTIDLTVNRASKISAFRVFKDSAEKLKQGISVVMFPEATI